MPRASKKEIKRELRQCRGFIATAARRLNMRRTSLYRIIDREQELQELLEDIREETKDMCEMHAVKRIEAGEWDAVKWYLCQQAKDRGYGESVRHQHKHEPTGPIQITQIEDWYGNDAHHRIARAISGSREDGSQPGAQRASEA